MTGARWPVRDATPLHGLFLQVPREDERRAGVSQLNSPRLGWPGSSSRLGLHSPNLQGRDLSGG